MNDSFKHLYESVFLFAQKLKIELYMEQDDYFELTLIDEDNRVKGWMRLYGVKNITEQKSKAKYISKIKDTLIAIFSLIGAK